MGLRSYLLANTSLVDGGKWETGKMTKAVFPLSKNNSLRLGNGWQWRLVRLKYGADVCRLLITLHEQKQNAHAYLGIESGADIRVICILEHHSTHGGWHLHASCDHNHAPLGRLRWPGIKRIPRGHGFNKEVDGLLTRDAVLVRALKAFRAFKLGGAAI